MKKLLRMVFKQNIAVCVQSEAANNNRNVSDPAWLCNCPQDKYETVHPIYLLTGTEVLYVLPSEKFQFVKNHFRS